MSINRRARCEGGQSTVEWIGLVLFVSLAMTFLAGLAGLALPGAALGKAITEKIICAVGLEDCASLGEAAALDAAYGEELAALVIEHAPMLIYEPGMAQLPIDFRSCREVECSVGPVSGEVLASNTGEPVTLFSHVVDCRAPTSAEDPGCSGERAGALYLQYWAYYPDSQTDPFGERGYHPDDWESFQARITAGEEIESRASSHHGYNHGGGIDNWPSDAGITSRGGWGESQGRYYISSGSHAGHASDDLDDQLFRWTPGEVVRIIPLEPVALGPAGATEFAVTPPWLKDVWLDPEAEGTS